ncbi:hypothetical protein CDAR_316081 [Caerostris darwini]|uniref:Uncharacterized protein n=1 Tax=Caerostris darwini TaxID=1538125 RepID=A0AAV4TTV8_9ARAC|nr:hypothetical protein CDAR_316081 [Caerostris darwini]
MNMLILQHMLIPFSCSVVSMCCSHYIDKRHFSELRNSEEEAIPFLENFPIRKRGSEAGKYLLSCHPPLMANQYPPLVGPSTLSALSFNAPETIAPSEESRSHDVIFDFAHHPSPSR